MSASLESERPSIGVVAVDGGEMGRRIRAFPWETTPIGAMDKWPQSLRTAVNILLSSRYAMWMAWGPELTFLCNDTYLPTLGIKQPWALGARADAVWAEIWPDIGPRVQTVITTGEATYDEGLLLLLQRSGFPEETYHTFSYSPLIDDEGRIAGMICVVAEETERVIGERRLQTLRHLASALSGSNTEEEVFRTVSEQLARNQKDLPFTATYLFKDQDQASLVSCSGIDAGHVLAPATMAASALFPSGNPAEWPSAVLEDLTARCNAQSLPLGAWNKPADRAVSIPIGKHNQEQCAGVFIAGLNPYRRFDAPYQGFIDLLAGQIAAALSNARAYEAERRRAEALAEVDRAKTTFFSNVSHELRTPLTLLLSPVEELLAATSADPKAQKLLHLVHRNGLRLQKLVNTLLDFSRIEAGRMQAFYEPTELCRLTEDLASNFRSAFERAGLAYKVTCEPFDAPVYVDREMWEKIVLNLISNALKFTLHGSVSVSLKQVDRAAELRIEDTGVGIPETELPRIFERFHRIESAQGRSIEGTGIGLALVQELVRLHGGTIDVRSKSGSGTTFTVRVPLGTAHLATERVRQPRDAAPLTSAVSFIEEALRWPAASGHSGPASPATSQPAGRILLADDNDDMLQYVQSLLSGSYAVTTATNGSEALRVALADPPDLVLSDVMMPGMNGFELVDALRRHDATRTVPVVLLSARAGEESRVEGLEAGADDYLVKPFTARELLARVAAHIAMHRRRREAETALHESQATLQSFYDSSPLLMGVAELDGDTIIAVYGNAATASFFGIPSQQVSLENVREVGVPAEVDRLWIEKYRDSQSRLQPVQFEYEHPKPTGARWLRATATYLGLGPTGLPRFSFVAEDITERKRAEQIIATSNEELRRANMDLGQFAYSASHDLQEPLRQVAVYSQLLEKKYAAVLDAKGLEYLSYCVEGAHRMELLISDLLAYSQATNTSGEELERVDLNEVVEDVKSNLSTLIEETGTTITVEPLPSVPGHHVPLGHLFQNLISNAIKYRSARPAHVKISAEREGASWLFRVEDNGIGIPEQFHDQIFGIFKRLHDKKAYPGTGIGLAICQKVVERYGGRIWVESEDGKGSTFIFTLPNDVH